jgi:hypothetical protein
VDVRELGRRISVAWCVLRDGEPTAPAPAPQVVVPLHEVIEMVRWSMVAAGLAPLWADHATTDELLCAHGAIGIAITTRHQEWAQVEYGRWS